MSGGSPVKRLNSDKGVYRTPEHAKPPKVTRKPTAAEIARKVDGEPKPARKPVTFLIKDGDGNVTDARDELRHPGGWR